jgi:hypothetical protein
MRKGRISNVEARAIEDRINDGVSVDVIARELDRDPKSIHSFVKRKLNIGATEVEAAEFDLESKPYWPELKGQFTEEELKMFKYHWTRVISQFKDDVIPTEEIQVVDMVKLDILMNRRLNTDKQNIDQISELRRLLDEMGPPSVEDPDGMEATLRMEQQLGVLQAAQESIGRDYRDLQDKKNKMLKDMRATREQRVKKYEDSKQSFVAWMTQLMTKPELVKKYGLDMEKRRLAMLEEARRLSEHHTYTDGTIDQPFLTPESVKD